MNSNNTQNSLNFLSYILTILFISLLVFFFFFANRGFDITDESYYILNLASPQDQFPLTHFFAYYGKFLWFFSLESLYLFRLNGFLIHNLLAFCLAKELYSFLKHNLDSDFHVPYRTPFLLIIVLASNLYYSSKILTPSYNWFVYISALLYFIGYLKILKNHSSFLGVFLVSTAGFFAFFSKAPTSLPFFILTIPLLLKKERCLFFLKVGIPFLFGLFLIHHLFIQDLFIYYKRLAAGILIADLQGLSFDINRVFYKIRSSLTDLISVFFLDPTNIILAFLTAYIIYSNKLKSYPHKLSEKPGIIISLFFIYQLVPVILGTNIYFNNHVMHTLFGLLCISLGLFFFTVFLRAKNKSQYNTLFIVLFLCLFLPGAYAFGTTNLFLSQMTHCSMFWISALLILSLYLSENIKKTWPFTLCITASIIIIGLQFFVFLEQPYRLNKSYFEQTESTHLQWGGNILVDHKTRNYIEKLKNAIPANQDAEIFLLDFTGETPGANVILGAKFTIMPWMLYLTVNNTNFNKSFYNICSKKDLLTSWLLVEKTDEEATKMFMNNIGIIFSKNYTKQAELISPVSNTKQLLFRPILY